MKPFVEYRISDIYNKKYSMYKVLYCLLMIGILLFTGGCSEEETGKEQDLKVTAKTARLISVNNEFGFDLYKNISAFESKAENLMVSPLSVALALSMTYNGAETTTKEAMEKTLRLQGLSREEINESYQSLVLALKTLDPKVLLEIANSIYYRQDFQVEDAFISVNKKYYDAEISGLDFNSPKAIETINNWVNVKTHTKIPEILKEINPGHVMFLLNAIYFKGTWTKEFNPKITELLPFTLESGQSIKVPMMTRLDTVGYMTDDFFSAIRLTYGKGSFNMFVLLPDQGKTVKDLVSQLDPDNWKGWLSEFKETDNVDIRLPQFKFAYEIKLNDVLTGMGMGIAFSGGADFTGINKGGGLNIDYVRHKTFVEVNEEGTEAAAVTIVAIEKNMTGPKTIPFYVNKPFLFVITEKSTGAILFMGTVKNPAG
jgi:serine protease inhibitor